MDYVEKTPNKETKVELIRTLQSVTEGKVSVLMHIHECGIVHLLFSTHTRSPFVSQGGLVVQIYVEIERARLTRKLAQLKEQEGNIAEAADVLQEVAVVSLTHSCSKSLCHQCTHPCT